MHKHTKMLFIKPGMCRPVAGAPGFLKLFLCERLYVCVCVCLRVCVRVCVCVSAPEAINN